MNTLDDQNVFSCDLTVNALLHKRFLEVLHHQGITLHPPTVTSLRRYSKRWLPLVDVFYRNHCKFSMDDESVEDITNTNLTLVPPADVAWIWHCHRLAPFRYLEYTQKHYDSAKSTVLESSHPFWFQCHPDNSQSIESTLRIEVPEDQERFFQQSCQSTQQLWRELYPDEPFFLPILDGGNISNHPGESNSESLLWEDSFNFNLYESCVRQSTFLWQISGDHFSDPAFLRQGVENYYKFLRLKSTPRGRNMIIVPTYQIDLLWHTHILTSIAKYNMDCRNIMNSTLHHDDSLNDRTEESLLDISFSATKELWYEMYGEDYIVPGGMYRGEPPFLYYTKEWPLLKKRGELHVQGSDSPNDLHNLIGIVGASSTTNHEINNDIHEGQLILGDTTGLHVVQAYPVSDESERESSWADVTTMLSSSPRVGWMLLNEECAFIRVNVKEKKHPRLEGYIYGLILPLDRYGSGYYNIHTRAALELIRRRIEHQLGDPFHQFAVGFIGNGDKLKRQMFLKDFLELVLAMMERWYPYHELKVSKALIRGLELKGLKRNSTEHVGSSEWFRSNIPFFCNAAGCGSSNGGGSCGGTYDVHAGNPNPSDLAC